MANEPMYKKIYEDLLDGIKVGTDCLPKKNLSICIRLAG